jgi:hypothetical protein
MAEIAKLYPKIDFSKVKFYRIPKNGFLIGFDSNNNNKLSKIDRSGNITIIESFEGGPDDSNFQFFAQASVPNTENGIELYHGNIWYDTFNAVSYIYTKIDVDHFVWLSLQPNETESSFESLSKSQILNIDHPIDGELIYNNTDQEYVFYNGTSWKKIITEDL